jgi:hypothetical protein
VGLREPDELEMRRSLVSSLGHASGGKGLRCKPSYEQAGMTIYAGPMTDSRPTVRESEDVAEQANETAARRARDRALSMSERLERVHQLCAQLARLDPVRPKQR